MAELLTLTAYAEIFGAVTVLGGLVFAGLQIKASKEQHRETVALETLSRFSSTPGLAEHIRNIERLPEEGAVEFAASHPFAQESVDTVYALCESLGFLVHERSLRLDQVSTLFGGAIVSVWDKLEPLAKHERATTGRTGAYEWTEWLVARLMESGDPRQAGHALQRHADWRA